MTGKESDRLFEEALNHFNNEYDLDRIEKSLPIFKELAKQGHPGGSYYLGNLYENRIGVKKDWNKAIELYEQAAQKGHADAQYKLGGYYYFGWDIPDVTAENIGSDQKKGLEYWEKAADQGHEEAKEQLFRLGVSTKQMSKSEQNKLFKEAKTFLDENNYDKAIPLFNKLDKEGHTEAQYELGICYIEGWGVEADENKAGELFCKAAEKGHSSSQTEAGRYYYFNKNSNIQDKKKGIEMWKQAAKQGNGYAEFFLNEIEEGII